MPEATNDIPENKAVIPAVIIAAIPHQSRKIPGIMISAISKQKPKINQCHTVQVENHSIIPISAIDFIGKGAKNSAPIVN